MQFADTMGLVRNTQVRYKSTRQTNALNRLELLHPKAKFLAPVLRHFLQTEETMLQVEWPTDKRHETEDMHNFKISATGQCKPQGARNHSTKKNTR